MAGQQPALTARDLPPRSRASGFTYLYWACFLVALVVSYRLAEINPLLIFRAEGLVHAKRFLSGMFPPELSWTFLRFLVRPVIETIQISVVGTVLAILIGLPLGLLGTSTLTYRGVLHEMETGRAPLRRTLGFLVYALARGLLSVFRAIPEIVWAFLFVRVLGLGPAPAVLAIGVAYGGMLGKVYSEILEAVNPQPIEALQATGASKLQILVYGILPQTTNEFLSYSLYRWECAVRASAILGFVGAGGIGQQLELSMRMFQFNEVITLLAILFVLVAGVDYLSSKIRAGLGKTMRRQSASPRSAPSLAWSLSIATFLVFFFWSYRHTGINVFELLSPAAMGQIGGYVKRFFPPDFSGPVVWGTLWGLLETFALSFMGTVLALLLALPMVLLGSRNLAYAGLLFEMEKQRHWRRGIRIALYSAVRLVFNLLRTIPELVWAMIFVFVVGLGPFAGVLALGMHTAGVLGKLFSDVVEGVNRGPVEAIQSTGANRVQTFCLGVLPQVAPQFLAYGLYRWEVNIRAATILGFVGAGGLGQHIYVAINLFWEQQLLTLMLAVYLLVTLVDYLSLLLRTRLI